MGSKDKEDKQYGLILAKKKTSTEIKRPAVFNNDSDSDASDAGTTDWIKKAYRKQVAANSGGVSRQTQIDRQRALAQDATVYQYDEVYDEIEKKKEEQTLTKKEEQKKPRYILNLLKKAEARKMENERRIERQVQKEREEEGEEFKDKETFVTSAYKKKLEEFQKLDEEERRQDMLEDICDVSKQQDLGGFYRHLYRQTVDIKKEDDKGEKEEVKEDKKIISKEGEDKRPSSTKRQYRKRRNSPEPSSAEEGERLDSDTDCSSSSSSSSASSRSSSGSSRASHKSKTDTKHTDDEKKVKKPKLESDVGTDLKKTKVKKTPETGKSSEPIRNDEESAKKKDRTTKDEDKTASETKKKDKTTKDEDKTASETKKVVDVKPKINVWLKRTVGAVFDEAVKRYFERKALRQGGQGN